MSPNQSCLKGGSTLISRDDAFSIYLEVRVVSWDILWIWSPIRSLSFVNIDLRFEPPLVVRSIFTIYLRHDVEHGSTIFLDIKKYIKNVIKVGHKNLRKIFTKLILSCWHHHWFGIEQGYDFKKCYHLEIDY